MTRYLKFRARFAEWWAMLSLKKFREKKKKKAQEPKGLVKRFYDLEISSGSWLVSPGSVERGEFIKELADLEESHDRLAMLRDERQPDTIIRRRDAVEATKKKMGMQDE